MNRTDITRIGIMGGMFDPVHFGHLALARQARDHCGLDRVLLVPCGSPVHRAPARASGEQRIRMLELAVGNCDWLQVDPRECIREAPSYTYDTVTAIHAEQPSARLFLLVGLDAFLGFGQWYRWHELLDLVQLVVVTRPQYTLDADALPPALATEFERRRSEDSSAAGAGRIVLADLDTPALSSTAVRAAVTGGADTEQFLPAAVADYIHAQGLYRT